MKLRCTQNSVRLRLRKSDIAQLDTAGKVAESVQFGPNQILTFELNKLGGEQVQATFQRNNLIVSLPASQAHTWIHSNQVGIEVFHPLTKAQQLHILIEKDFPCKDRLDEDKSDTFEELAATEGDAC